MFRQYQHQGSAGSRTTVRTISGVSQSSETMKSVNGSPAEETAPSTVIELTVDELAQKSLDSAFSSTITSRPAEASDGREHTSITVSNILARVEEVEPVDESSADGSVVSKETESGVIQKANAEEQREEIDVQKAMTEISSDKNNEDQETVHCNQPETDDTKAAEVVGDSTTTTSDDAQTPGTDGETVKSEDNIGKSVNSTTEDTVNEGDLEIPVDSEHGDETDQKSPEPASCPENSVMGGASVFNEDDVSSVSDQICHSNADDSQEESSYASAATGEEGDVLKQEGDKAEDDEGKIKDQEGQETEEEKEGKQEAGVQENEARESVEKQVPCLNSETPPVDVPEKSVTESPKENVSDGHSSSINEAASEDQQPSDPTLPSSTEVFPAASDSTSVSQPSETSGTTAGEAPPGVADSSTTASSSDTHKSTDSASKTKEIKIARLDVSNVALDTERLELKETSSTVRIYFYIYKHAASVSHVEPL